MGRKPIPLHLKDRDSTVRKIAEQCRLESEGGMRPKDLAETLDVSRATVGKYLRKLHAADLLHRIHGEGRATYYDTTPKYNDFLEFENRIEQMEKELENLRDKRDEFLRGGSQENTLEEFLDLGSEKEKEEG